MTYRCLSYVFPFVIGVMGCSLSDLVSGNELPADARDPNAVKTPAGALAAYNGALIALASATSHIVIETGLLTDELQSDLARQLTARFPTGASAAIDARVDTGGGGSFRELSVVRAHTREAIGALRKYHPTAPSALIGHLFAVEGMAEILLAEAFCSGIPLSTLDFEGDFTLESGFSSEEVYSHALVLFDSALVLASDSARIVHFTQLGRARALLARHEYTAAAQAVVDIPASFTYALSYRVGRENTFQTDLSVGRWSYSVGDREGGNGLPFRSSGDPRTRSDSIGADGGRWSPRKYLPAASAPDGNPGTMPIVLASGIEARLIEAEAALAGNDARWLSTLNTLRTTCLTEVDCPTPAPAGMGGVTGLPLLKDPGLETLPVGKTEHDVRVDLLFQERAYWLFLTGHRQGDLRRLVRQYERDQSMVYPVGPWGTQSMVGFGVDVTLMVPVIERQHNPFYRGCINRDA